MFKCVCLNLSIYIYICVCVCVCVCGERERGIGLWMLGWCCPETVSSYICFLKHAGD